MEMISNLEEPLRGVPYKFTINREYNKKSRSLQGPKRAIRLFILCIVLPGLLISVPLYLKHRVYEYQIYPVGMSDMRLLDNRVSTLWCQRQLVKANVSFNAFLMPEQPIVATDRLHVSMTRHLILNDDMKEYWGFYLLKNSTVTVSSCARWPGASLIVIKGHHHLHECAYIGDDSSEELQELMEIAAEQGIPFDRRNYVSDDSDDSPSNRPELLRKGNPGIIYHDPILNGNANNYTFAPNSNSKDTTENLNTKQKMDLLKKLSAKKGDKLKVDGRTVKQRIETLKNAEHKVHTIRKPNFGINERENLKIINEQGHQLNSLIVNSNESSVEIFQKVLKKLSKMGPKGKHVLDLLKNKLLVEKEFGSETIKSTLPPIINSIKLMDESDDEATTKGNNVTIDDDDDDAGEANHKDDEIWDEKPEEIIERLKREITLKQSMEKDFNNDYENENLAIEEGYTPDGIADHHHILNETTLNDRSNSEFWSSFSSSEEALLNCAGLILSLPLNPHRQCESHRNGKDFSDASFSNTITYTTPTNGYYFFVYNSENEIQENYLRVHFNLHKTIYNVSNSIKKCTTIMGNAATANTTTTDNSNNNNNDNNNNNNNDKDNSTIPEQCNFKLNFFSNEKVVFELPVGKNPNETLWNEEYIVVSECEPRTLVYLICVLSVPLIILLFAFH